MKLSEIIAGIDVRDIQKYRSSDKGVNNDYNKVRVTLDLTLPQHLSLYHALKNKMHAGEDDKELEHVLLEIDKFDEIKKVWDDFKSKNEKIDQLVRCLAVTKNGHIILSPIINNKIYIDDQEQDFDWLADARSIIILITTMAKILDD
jgi:hypothetical protein